MGRLINIGVQDLGGGQQPRSASLGQSTLFGQIGSEAPQVGVMVPARLGVPYVERWPGSPIIRLANDGTEIQRTYFCPWSCFVEAAKNLLGYGVVTPGPVAGYYISRYLPDAFPYLLSTNSGFEAPRPFVWCESLPNIEGVGCPPGGAPEGFPVTLDQFGVANYYSAKIVAIYRTLSYEVYGDWELPTDPATGGPDESSLLRNVTKTGQSTVSYQGLPTGSFVYVSDGAVVPSSPGRLTIESDVSLTWENVPQAAVPSRLANPYIPLLGPDGSLYVPAIEATLGKLNLSEFAGCPRGGLLFTACIITPIRSWLGNRDFKVEYKFKRFDAQSSVSYPAPPGSQSGGRSYGHVNILRTDASLNGFGFGVGYEEIVASAGIVGVTLPLPANQKPFGPQNSNYAAATPRDGVNIFDWASFPELFRVPYLGEP